MIVRTRLIAAVVMALTLIATGSIFANDNKKNSKSDDDDIKIDPKKPDVLVIKGKVIGDDGKPQPEAEIRVKRLDKKAPEVTAVTDSRGKYIVLGLVVGNYSITAYDPNGFARSRAILKIDRKGWAKVDFDLGLDTAVGTGANSIAGHEHFTNPNSHGAIISTVQ